METIELNREGSAIALGDKKAEVFLKHAYGNQAAQYRRDDEIEVTTEHHRHLRSVLESITTFFDRPIRVLDAGCGTGRYFHCLRNSPTIIGVDLCPAMLDAANRPVLAEEISARKITLICANIFDVSFPPNSFDVIYSMGMFALGCRFSAELCARFFEWLTPDGRLFFNVTDRDGMSQAKLRRQKLRKIIHRTAPQWIKRALDEREHHPEVQALTREELASIMSRTPFKRYRIISEACVSPLWTGRHLECLAWRTDQYRRWRRGDFSRSLPPGF